MISKSYCRSKFKKIWETLTLKNGSKGSYFYIFEFEVILIFGLMFKKITYRVVLRAKNLSGILLSLNVEFFIPIFLDGRVQIPRGQGRFSEILQQDASQSIGVAHVSVRRGGVVHDWEAETRLWLRVHVQTAANVSRYRPLERPQ